MRSGIQWLLTIAAPLMIAVPLACQSNLDLGPEPNSRTPKLERSAPETPSQTETGENRQEPVALAPVAVIELFTSEGCSSCPRADRELAKLASEAERGRPYFPLSFHVDYWNYLGWKDPYSSAEFSRRQRSYARRLSSGRVYTPQAVVNGQHAFVGSHASQLQAAVANALATAATTRVQVEVTRGKSRHWVVRTVVTPAKPNWTLHLALVQQHAQQDVPAGENAGSVLSHRNVVRKFRSLDVSSETNSWNVTVPNDVPPDDAMIVAYVQADNFRVLGASSAKPALPVSPP